MKRVVGSTKSSVLRRFAPQDDKCWWICSFLARLTGSEGEGEAAGEAALVLGEHQKGAVGEDVGAEALGQEVVQIEHHVQAPGAFAPVIDRLAELQIEEGLSSIRSEGSHRGNGFVRLPAIAGVPLRAGTFERAGQRD